MFRRYYDSAIELHRTNAAVLGAAARKTKTHLVIGVIEKDGGTLYCTVLFFGPDGALLGKHRKLMPTAMERLIWGFGDGSTLTVLDTPMGKLGAVICWENYMPLLRTAMYAKGVQIYCAPTADDRDTWVSTMQHVALEGRCFVLSACQYLTRGDCPDDYDAIQGGDPEDRADARRKLHRLPARQVDRRSRTSAGRPSSPPISISTTSRAANSISTSPVITRGRMCSICRSTSAR